MRPSKWIQVTLSAMCADLMIPTQGVASPLSENGKRENKVSISPNVLLVGLRSSSHYLLIKQCLLVAMVDYTNNHQSLTVLNAQNEMSFWPQHLSSECQHG